MCISSCVSALLKSSFVNPVVMVTVSNIARIFSIVELYIPDTIIFVTELLENSKVFFQRFIFTESISHLCVQAQRSQSLFQERHKQAFFKSTR